MVGEIPAGEAVGVAVGDGEEVVGAGVVMVGDEEVVGGAVVVEGVEEHAASNVINSAKVINTNHFEEKIILFIFILLLLKLASEYIYGKIKVKSA
jgi:hypothetical protein